METLLNEMIKEKSPLFVDSHYNRNIIYNILLIYFGRRI